MHQSHCPHTEILQMEPILGHSNHTDEHGAFNVGVGRLETVGHEEPLDPRLGVGISSRHLLVLPTSKNSLAGRVLAYCIESSS